MDNAIQGFTDRIRSYYLLNRHHFHSVDSPRLTSTYKMTSPTAEFLQSKGLTNQFVNDVAVHTMTTYYRREEKDASPITGFCIPVEPETRLTNSPTGGVVGRHLARPIDYGSPSRMTSTATSSAHSSPALINNDAGPALHRHLLQGQKGVVESTYSQPQGQAETDFMGGTHEMHQVSPNLRRKLISTSSHLTWSQHASAVRGQLHLAQQYGTGAQSVHIQQPLSFQATYAHHGNVPLASASAGHDYYSPNPESNYAGTQKKQAFAPSGPNSASHKQLDPEDMEFLMKTLDEQVKASSNVSLMTLLVPVHQGRPGKHILRMNEQTGELYACIPGNPFAPKNNAEGQDYNLATYDSFFQKTIGGRLAQNPYPAVGLSSLNTCNHCGIPTKVLNNDSLCPFHAYYLATGEFLGYYEFCALVEMEKEGLSIASGWWTIEDMVQFVDALAKRIQMWVFIEESSAIPDGSWVGKVSPYGAIGESVPSRAQGKTAYRVGTEQKMARAVGRQTAPVTMEKTAFQVQAEQTLAMVMDRQLDLTSAGTRLDHVYKGTTGAICV